MIKAFIGGDISDLPDNKFLARYLLPQNSINLDTGSSIGFIPTQISIFTDLTSNIVINP